MLKESFVVVRAIQSVVVLVRAVSADRHRLPADDEKASGKPHGSGAGDEERQLREVSPVERKVLNPALIHDVTDRRRDGLQQGNGASHLDGLRNRT